MSEVLFGLYVAAAMLTVCRVAYEYERDKLWNAEGAWGVLLLAAVAWPLFAPVMLGTALAERAKRPTRNLPETTNVE